MILPKLSKTVVYPSLFLVGIIGFAMGGSVSSTSTTNEVLKMCNQKPLECKFKYDILMYEKDGRVPYADPTKVQPKPEKK